MFPTEQRRIRSRKHEPLHWARPPPLGISFKIMKRSRIRYDKLLGPMALDSLRKSSDPVGPSRESSRGDHSSQQGECPASCGTQPWCHSTTANKVGHPGYKHLRVKTTQMETRGKKDSHPDWRREMQLARLFLNLQCTWGEISFRNPYVPQEYRFCITSCPLWPPPAKPDN